MTRACWTYPQPGNLRGFPAFNGYSPFQRAMSMSDRPPGPFIRDPDNMMGWSAGVLVAVGLLAFSWSVGGGVLAGRRVAGTSPPVTTGQAPPSSTNLNSPR